MMKSIWAALLAAVFLASCGGGEESAQQTDFSNAPLALADPSACKTPSADYALVNDQCVKTWTPMRAPAATSLPAQRSIPTLTNAALYAWAAQHFPSYFNGSTQDGFIEGITYRYFAGTDSYIGIGGSSVYVLGPLSNYKVTYVGEMFDFTCLVYPTACDVPANTSTTSTLQVNSSLTGSIDWAGDQDWHAIFLTGGQTYVFDLEGSPTGQGTLPDAYLQLINPSGLSVSQNDDVEGSRNSRIIYPALSSGWYYLSAEAFEDNVGTYRLTARIAPPTGGGGGGGGGGGPIDWESSYSAEEIVEFNSIMAANARQGWRFQVTGGNLPVEIIFATQYSASMYVTTGETMESCVNGGPFTHTRDYDFIGQQGYKSLTLPIGDYGICIINSNAANAMRLEFQRQPSVTGFHFLQARFPTIVETVANGGRFTQPVTVGDSYRVIVDGANSGGEFYIIPASEHDNFVNDRGFSYYDMSETCLISDRAAPGLCELTGVGQYEIAYRNDTGSPQSIVIIGRDYVPD